ncbi:MAG: hypothetical protein ACTHL1_07490 [Burkholderiaceae bacterium]
MNPLRTGLIAVVSLALCGCIEVEQHPHWVHGAYDGKPDNLPAQAHFHGDRLAWHAAIVDRNERQNEYRRMKEVIRP